MSLMIGWVVVTSFLSIPTITGLEKGRRALIHSNKNKLVGVTDDDLFFFVRWLVHKGHYKKSNSNTKVQEEAETNSETFCSKTNQRWIFWLCYLPGKSSSLLICLLPYIRTRSLQCSPPLVSLLFCSSPPPRLSSLSPLLFPFLALFLPPSGLPCHSSPLVILFPPLSLFLRPSLPPSFFLSFSNGFSKHITSYSQLCSLCVNSLSRSPIWVVILIPCGTMSSFSTNKAFHFPWTDF